MYITQCWRVKFSNSLHLVSGRWSTNGYNLNSMSERLQKILAQAGYGSRRACEDFISAGQVRVNGQLAELGQKADPVVDKITVDGKAIAAAEALIYIALHKPRNVLSTVE